MSQQFADRQHVDARFQHAGRKTVSHRVRRGVFLDAGFGDRQLAGFLNGSRGQWCVGSLAREEIIAGPGLLPIFSQFVQQSRRRWNDSLFAPLAAVDSNLIPVAVDVGYLQVRRFSKPQSRCVAGQQHRSVFGIVQTFE